MPRAAIPTDVFDSIAHIRCAAQSGVETVIGRGQHRLHQLQAAQLKPIHDWVKEYERYWTHQLNRTRNVPRKCNGADRKRDQATRFKSLNPGGLMLESILEQMGPTNEAPYPGAILMVLEA